MSYRIITLKDGIRCVDSCNQALEVIRVGEAAKRNGYDVLIAAPGDSTEKTLDRFKQSLGVPEGRISA